MSGDAGQLTREVQHATYQKLRPKWQKKLMGEKYYKKCPLFTVYTGGLLELTFGGIFGWHFLQLNCHPDTGVLQKLEKR